MARHVRRLLRYQVHAHNQPASGPVRRTYLPEPRNQSRFALGRAIGAGAPTSRRGPARMSRAVSRRRATERR